LGQVQRALNKLDQALWFDYLWNASLDALAVTKFTLIQLTS